MPRTKNWLTYPQSFRDLLEIAVTRRVEIPCSSETEAKSLRGQIYGFFAALQMEIDKKDGDKEARRLRNLSTQAKFSIEGNLLVAIPSEMTPAARLVSSALAADNLKSPMQPADARVPSPALLDLLRKEAKTEPGE
jgi:hypothetical protein